MSQDLADQFEQAIENDNRGAHVERIETRSCTSDEYDGVEYKIYGRFVPIRPVVDIIAEKDGLAIEQLYHVTEDGEPFVGVFVADVPERPHPAFIN
jgi:hypothetical protein